MRNLTAVRMVVGGLAVLGAAMCVGCGGKNLGAEDGAAPDAVRVRVDLTKVVNADIVGAGWNVGPLWMPSPRYGDTKDLDAYFALLKDSRVPWIRMMLQHYEWECRAGNGSQPVYENDDDNPWTSPKEFLGADFKGFAWNTREGLDWRIVYLLDFCEANAIDVEVNNWDTVLKPWLKLEAGVDGHITKEEYERKADEFGENVAALLYYLKTRANGGKGYSRVKYYALWNEPGGGYKGQDFVSSDFPGFLNRLHKGVHDHLVAYDKEMGTDTRGGLTCIGFESFPFWRNSPASGHAEEDWDELLGKGVIQYQEKPDGRPGEITDWPSADPYMDAVSIHEYWSVFDYDRNNHSTENHGTIEERLLRDIVGRSREQIETFDTDGKRQTLFVNEIGSKSYVPGEDSPALYDHMLFNVEALIRCFQQGVKGASVWAWNMHKAYAAVSYPGCWWEVEPLGTVHPINANYYPYCLLLRAAPRGAHVVETTVEGGMDDSRGGETWEAVNAQRVWACGFKNAKGRLSVLIVNDSYKPHNLEMQAPIFNGIFQKRYVTPDSHDRIRMGALFEVTALKPTLRDVLPPRSIVLYSELTNPTKKKAGE